MNPFARFLRRRRERRAIEAYARGYQFAAGALLAGDTVDQLKKKTAEARAANTYTPFDRGIEYACSSWINHIRKQRRT